MMPGNPAKYEMIDAIQETFHLAVDRDNYKGGAFKGKITSGTKPLEALDMFLASPLLDDSEKSVFRAARPALVRQSQGLWEDLNDLELLKDYLPFEKISDAFEEDMRKRGDYVPPFMVQSYDPATKTVSKTFTFDKAEGEKVYLGGTLGVIPGAPPGFNKDSSQKGSQDAKSNGAGNGSAKTEKENSKGDSGDRDTGFGAAFSKNIRNAFR